MDDFLKDFRPKEVEHKLIYRDGLMVYTCSCGLECAKLSVSRRVDESKEQYKARAQVEFEKHKVAHAFLHKWLLKKN